MPVDSDELDDDDQTDGNADRTADLLSVGEVECVQDPPGEEVAPAADGRAVDERERPVVAGSEPEQATVVRRPLAVETAGRVRVEDRALAEACFDLGGTVNRVVVDLGVSQLVEDDAECRDEPDRADSDQLGSARLPAEY